jgi:hypothetical protein
MFQNDETLPNFIFKNAPIKERERKRNKGQGPKSRQTTSSPSMRVPKALLSHGPPI